MFLEAVSKLVQFCTKFGWRIHLGIDEMYEIAQQAKYRFFGSVKCIKFMMDEMHEIGQLAAEFEYEYCRISVVSVVRA